MLLTLPNPNAMNVRSILSRMRPERISATTAPWGTARITTNRITAWLGLLVLPPVSLQVRLLAYPRVAPLLCLPEHPLVSPLEALLPCQPIPLEGLPHSLLEAPPEAPLDNLLAALLASPLMSRQVSPPPLPRCTSPRIS